MVSEANEDYVVWKALDWHPADVSIMDTRNVTAHFWEPFNQAQGLARCTGKTFGDARISLAIPRHRITELWLGLLDDFEALQRRRTSFSTRSMTTRQSVDSSSPARAAATRRSISAAHAASTSS